MIRLERLLVIISRDVQTFGRHSRGCSFLTKTINAERVGALAVIIFDNKHENDDSMIDMIKDETDRSTGIPSFFLLGKDGCVCTLYLTCDYDPGPQTHRDLSFSGFFAVVFWAVSHPTRLCLVQPVTGEGTPGTLSPENFCP